jgi:hypothetical protein
MKIIQIVETSKLKTVYFDHEGELHREDSILVLTEEADTQNRVIRKIVPFYWDNEECKFQESDGIEGFLGLEFNGQAKSWNDKLTTLIGERKYLRAPVDEIIDNDNIKDTCKNKLGRKK